MNRYVIVTLIIVIAIMIYFVNKLFFSRNENFTALGPIGQPLVTYDDYGTFNFIFHTDDLPYYDHEYDDLEYNYKDFDTVDLNTNSKKCGSFNCILTKNENFNKDSFIDYQGNKVRRELVPMNYFMNDQYADADFERNQLHLAIKKDRPRQSAQPPQPYNVYFNKIPRLDEECNKPSSNEYLNRAEDHL